MAAGQLGLTRKQARTTFEDSLAHEYRDIAHQLPVKALLGRELKGEEAANALPTFYRYVDLCNEQIFLRQNGRIYKATWHNWSEGIASQLGKPAFKAAWEHIKAKAPGSFQELRRLEKSGFKDDPYKWRNRAESRKEKARANQQPTPVEKLRAKKEDAIPLQTSSAVVSDPEARKQRLTGAVGGTADTKDEVG